MAKRATVRKFEECEARVERDGLAKTRAENRAKLAKLQMQARIAQASVFNAARSLRAALREFECNPGMLALCDSIGESGEAMMVSRRYVTGEWIENGEEDETGRFCRAIDFLVLTSAGFEIAREIQCRPLALNGGGFRYESTQLLPREECPLDGSGKITSGSARFDTFTQAGINLGIVPSCEAIRIEDLVGLCRHGLSMDVIKASIASHLAVILGKRTELPH